jgi:ketosteroid isomerase-like protein
MPPSENVTVETLAAICDAFNRHDLAAIMAFFADDAVLEMPRGPHPWGARFVGTDDVRGTCHAIHRHSGRALRR